MMCCPTSHVEADGKLISMFLPSQNPNVFRVVSTEIFDGRHVVFDPTVLTCPTCHIIAARPFFHEYYPRTTEPRRSEIGLNRYHQGHR